MLGHVHESHGQAALTCDAKVWCCSSVCAEFRMCFGLPTCDQQSPKNMTRQKFPVQGIETVRRDGCPAVVKIQERTMRTLFETQDLSAVRSYLQRQWTKILAGRVSLQDFVFAKEVRHLQRLPAASCRARKDCLTELPHADAAGGMHAYTAADVRLAAQRSLTNCFWTSCS